MHQQFVTNDGEAFFDMSRINLSFGKAERQNISDFFLLEITKGQNSSLNRHKLRFHEDIYLEEKYIKNMCKVFFSDGVNDKASANTASSEPQCYKKSDRTQDAGRRSQEIHCRIAVSLRRVCQII